MNPVYLSIIAGLVNLFSFGFSSMASISLTKSRGALAVSVIRLYTGLVFCSLLVLATKTIVNLPPHELGLSIILAILYATASIFFLKSLAIGPVSLTTPIASSRPGI